MESEIAVLDTTGIIDGLGGEGRAAFGGEVAVTAVVVEGKEETIFGTPSQCVVGAKIDPADIAAELFAKADRVGGLLAIGYRYPFGGHVESYRRSASDKETAFLISINIIEEIGGEFRVTEGDIIFGGQSGGYLVGYFLHVGKRGAERDLVEDLRFQYHASGKTGLTRGLHFAAPGSQFAAVPECRSPHIRCGDTAGNTDPCLRNTGKTKAEKGDCKK